MAKNIFVLLSMVLIWMSGISACALTLPVDALSAEDKPAASATRFLLFPMSESFSDRTLAWIAEGVMESISEQISKTGYESITQSMRADLLDKNDLPPHAVLSRGSMIRIAQDAKAHFLVFGKCEESESNISIAINVLDMNALKMNAEIIASGPLETLPQIENELAWKLLMYADKASNLSRREVGDQIRSIPNESYALFIQSLSAPSESEQIQLLNKAIEASMDFSAAHFQLARLHYQNRSWKQAIAHLDKGMQSSFPRWIGEFMLGASHLQSGNHREAIRIFAPIALLRQNVQARNNLGIACMQLGENVSATYAFSIAHAQSPEDTTIAANLAIVRLMSGNISAAMNTVNDSLRKHPQNGMLLFLKGMLLRTLGDSSNASLSLEKARAQGIPVERLKPDNPQSWARANLRPTIQDSVRENPNSEK